MSEPETLVTVATFDLLYKAELARGLLEDSGIRTFLLDAETVNTNWFISGAVGGVKLQVAKEDFLAAERILSISSRGQGRGINLDDYGLAKSTAITSNPQEVRDDQEEFAQNGDDEPIEPSQADLTVERALRAALLGLVFFPPLLHFYSLSQLMPLQDLTAKVSPDRRNRLYVAIAINVVVISLAVLFLITFVVLAVRGP